MFDRLISFLKELPTAAHGDPHPTSDDPRMAAAALLVQVMDADGVQLGVERDALKDALTRAYGLSGRALDEFLAAAEETAHQSIDLYTFTSVLKRHLDEQARVEFVRIMWEIVFADGEMSEVEDNIVWRIAELIGVERHDRIAMRRQADGTRGPGKGQDI